MSEIKHPSKIVIPVETALADWTHAGGIVMEKKDGEFALIQVEDFFVTAEKMRDGEIFAFDLVKISGQDIRAATLDARWFALNARRRILADNKIQIIPSCSSEHGADFLSIVLKAGGEGCVKKDFGASYWTPMIAAKRSQIHVCRITSVGPSQSITVCDSVTGQPRGKVPAKGGLADVLRVGNFVRVECETIHESGLFRSAKLCREYLVK